MERILRGLLSEKDLKTRESQQAENGREMVAGLTKEKGYSNWRGKTVLGGETKRNLCQTSRVSRSSKKFFCK